MKFKAEIDVMPLEEILDPQSKAVKLGLATLGIKEVYNVRIGRHILLEIEAENEETAKSKVEDACKRLLTNIVMEDYSYTISKI